METCDGFSYSTDFNDNEGSFMLRTMLAIFLVLTFFALSLADAAEPLDQRIVGTWQGMRESNGKCRFLAWRSTFMADGNFVISFFSDKGRTKLVQDERGTWKAQNGKSELKTNGVSNAEVYLYTVMDDDTIKYVNTVKDPSADCQEDYEFIEQRVRK